MGIDSPVSARPGRTLMPAAWVARGVEVITVVAVDRRGPLAIAIGIVEVHAEPKVSERGEHFPRAVRERLQQVRGRIRRGEVNFETAPGESDRECCGDRRLPYFAFAYDDDKPSPLTGQFVDGTGEGLHTRLAALGTHESRRRSGPPSRRTAC